MSRRRETGLFIEEGGAWGGANPTEKHKRGGEGYRYTSMENVDVDAVREAAFAVGPAQIRFLLQSESSRRELTISILNLLENLIVYQSIPTTAYQRQFFDERAEVIRSLLTKKPSLKRKKELLLKHPEIVRTVALACPDT